MRMLNILYNQMQQESLSLILDTDKTRQMYLKGWKCIWARQLNNKSQFTSFRLRPSFLHCPGPEGRDTPCSQGLGFDQKRKHGCGSQDCRVLSVLWPCSVWAGCQPSGHRVDVLSGESNPLRPQEYEWKEGNHPFCSFSRGSRGNSAVTAAPPAPAAGWHGPAQGRVGTADAYSLSVEQPPSGNSSWQN